MFQNPEMAEPQNEVTTKTPIRMIDGEQSSAKMVIRSCDFDRNLVELRIPEFPILTLDAEQLIEAIQNAWGDQPESDSTITGFHRKK